MLRTSGLALLAAIGVVVISACSVGDELQSSGPDQPTPAMSDDFTRPSATGAEKSLPPVSSTISGILAFDDIEGGCAFVEAADGTRYEVVYPEGWMLDMPKRELRTDDGQVVRAGEALTIRGTVASDRSSICQIGPIFIATDVELESP
jgi:hypothetical protein